jgi:hypothetical protein
LVIDNTQSAPKVTVPPAATAASNAASEHDVTWAGAWTAAAERETPTPTKPQHPATTAAATAVI